MVGFRQTGSGGFSLLDDPRKALFENFAIVDVGQVGGSAEVLCNYIYSISYVE